MVILRARSLLLTLVVVLPVVPARAEDLVFDHTTGARGTRMWVPPGVQTVRGILIYGNGAGGDSRNEVFTSWHQNFAKLHDFAVIGTSMWGNLAGGEISTWDAHIAALASASGHPELVHAPWAPMGFSNGGQMSYGFNALRPEKTIAFITNKGCCYVTGQPQAAALATPGILIAGELDTALRRNNIRALFDDNRPPRGALWSWVEQENHAHIGRADAMVIPFMDAAIRARYPRGRVPTATTGVALEPIGETSGWLTDQSSWTSGLTRIASHLDYVGDKTRAGWLLDEDLAAVYRAFSTYDRGATLRFDMPTLSDEIAAADVFPMTLRLRLDLAAVPDWTHVRLLDYADTLLERSAAMGEGENILQVDVPINRVGVYAFSALVTVADGAVITTSNPLAFTAVPEPMFVTLAVTLVVPLLRQRRAGAVHL